MTQDLLPINATPQERALSKATGKRIESIPVPIRDLWNPDKCPVVFLPWLAWALSVDLWKDEWSEAQKRAVIKASIAIHRKKGTPVAVENYLSALGYEARVLEWFEYDGDEYKFKVSTETGITEAIYLEMIEAVMVAKNTRSHLESIQFHSVLTNNMFAGGNVRTGDVQHIPHRFGIKVNPIQTYAGVAITQADIIKVGIRDSKINIAPIELGMGITMQQVDITTIPVREV
ncbi:phage tail protein I [Maridesulfovibrio salexigens]|uniref:Phage tail protein I n=1 Tax=Maridesulfovibrio salexigens (strain ATCC 14822 / DSM 2638 / NCIMB 8403 / VKM B-1763) TaxID=526222 RepID=C6BVX7_MARSD|nr:phage tail protein I [Maridesulfovibrio salexigens]ACS80180.1 phage tail protein I [Maridesulfovibrio salexigens DSM 2638]